MRMIFEQDIEGSDFLEFAVTPDEAREIGERGLCQDFIGGLIGERNLNVYLRLADYREESEQMPFKSKAQQKYLFSNEPQVAKEFAEHTPKSAYKKLPNKVGKPKSKAKKK